MSITTTQYQKLKHLVNILYSLPYSDEFRQPVSIKYPDLQQPYQDVVKYPIDLGTILLKLTNETYQHLDEVNKELILCFKNAILFNSDLSQMVSISNYLLLISEKLWIEFIKLPFYKMKNNNKMLISMNLDYHIDINDQNGLKTFQDMLYQYRVDHLLEVRNVKMNYDDVKQFHQQLEEFSCEDLDEEYENALKLMNKNCVELLSSSSSSSDRQDVEYPNLLKLINPLVDIVKKEIDSSQDDDEEDEDDQYSCFLKVIFNNNSDKDKDKDEDEDEDNKNNKNKKKSFPKKLSFKKNNFLKLFDDVLGTSLVLLFERQTRG